VRRLLLGLGFVLRVLGSGLSASWHGVRRLLLGLGFGFRVRVLGGGLRVIRELAQGALVVEGSWFRALDLGFFRV
jgi:hypothetical protein